MLQECADADTSLYIEQHPEWTRTSPTIYMRTVKRELLDIEATLDLERLHRQRALERLCVGTKPVLTGTRVLYDCAFEALFLT